MKLGNRLELLLDPSEVDYLAGFRPSAQGTLTRIYILGMGIPMYDIREIRPLAISLCFIKGYNPLELARYREYFDRYVISIRQKRYGDTINYCSINEGARSIGKSRKFLLPRLDIHGGPVKTARFTKLIAVFWDDVLALADVRIPEEKSIDVDFIYEQLLDKVYLP